MEYPKRITGHGQVANVYMLDDDGTETISVESELKGTILKITKLPEKT